MYKLLLVVVALLALSGCAVMTPGPLHGGLYQDIKYPSDAPNGAKIVEKTGEACATAILGMIATGDASLAAAANAGKITHITAVDYYSTNILGLYGKFCTIVRGE